MSTFDNPPNDAPAPSIKGNKFALIVGVNNTKNSPNDAVLLCAEKDARDMDYVLRQPACSFILSPALTGDYANTRAVQDAVWELAKHKEDQDFLLFYFIGHGQVIRTKKGFYDICLVTGDFDVERAKEDDTSYISVRWLQEQLHRPDGAGTVLFILDCCYSGNAVFPETDPSRIHIDIDIEEILKKLEGEFTSKEKRNRQHIILTATKHNRKAYEDDNHVHTLMTGLLLSALRGEIEEVANPDGDVEIEKIIPFLRREMLKNNPENNPILKGPLTRSCILACYKELSKEAIDKRRREEAAGVRGLGGRGQEAELLIRVSDLKRENFKLGGIGAANFNYIRIGPWEKTYNDAVATLESARDRNSASTTTKSEEKSQSQSTYGIVVLGEAAIGKTRLALETMIKTLPEWFILEWSPVKHIGHIPTPASLKNQNVVIFVDDLQTYAFAQSENKSRLVTNEYAENLRELWNRVRDYANQAVMVATCRDYATKSEGTSWSSLSWIFEELTKIELLRIIDPEEKEQIRKEFDLHKAPSIDEWDGTPGSAVLGLSKKHDEYRDLVTHNQPGAVILHAMKLLTLCGITEHTKSRIQHTCADVFGYTEFGDNKQIKRVWDTAVNQLTRMQLVKEQSNKKNGEAVLLIPQDIYFDKVIKDYPEESRPTQLKQDSNDLRGVLIELHDADALMAFGNEYDKKKRREDALEAYRGILSFDPKNVDAWRNKGRMLFLLDSDGERLEEALEAYETVINLKGNDPLAWRIKAYILYDLKRDDEALIACEYGLTLNRNDSHFWYIKGDVLQRSGKNQEALDAYNRSIVLSSDYTRTWRRKGGLLRTMSQETEAEAVYQEALVICEIEISRNPNDADNWDEKGRTLRSLGHFEAAIQAFEAASDREHVESKKALHWVSIGDTLRDWQQPKEAIEAHSRAICLDRTLVTAWNGLGNALLDLNHYDEALQVYEQAIELKKDAAYLWRNKGFALRKLDRLEDALVAYNKATELEPDSEESWNRLGNILKDLTRYDEALQAYEQALEKKPNTAYILRNKAFILRKLNRLDDALNVANLLISLDDKEPWAWNGKGYILAYLERYKEALGCIDKAIELDLHDPNFWDSKGEIYMMMQEDDKALEVLNKAIELNKETDLELLLESLRKKLLVCQRLNIEEETLKTQKHIEQLEHRDSDFGK